VPGETGLARLLAGMEPVLQPGEFVFCTVAAAPPDLDALATFREAEGLTIVCERAEAERLHLAYTFVCRLITLSVHSSLNAVGLLAAVSAQLARYDIPLNVVSAYYHDHLFVPAGAAEKALAALQRLK